jgi:hypothetical protein
MTGDRMLTIPTVEAILGRLARGTAGGAWLVVVKIETVSVDVLDGELP